MKTTPILGIGLLSLCGTALAGPVVDLQPGQFYDGLSGISRPELPELRGFTLFDQYTDIQIERPVAEEGTSSLYDGTLLTRVVRSYETGNLTFNFRLLGSGQDLNGLIKQVDITGFQGLQTRVEYRSEPGYGEVAPDTVSRSEDGDTLSYGFSTGLDTELSSMFFFAMLDVADYDFEANNPQATIHLYSGESITVDITAPSVPAPGSMALLGIAGLCVSRRRR